MKRTVIREIASLVDARLTCLARTKAAGGADTDGAEGWGWASRHTESLRSIERECLPSGSGIDNATSIDLLRSTGEKIVLTCSFHHMNAHGSYDGWTDHTITVRPSLLFGIAITISGRNRNDIKDHLSEVYHAALTAEYGG